MIDTKALSTFHTYFQKYYTSFEDIFLQSQSLTNAVSLPFNLFHLVQTRVYSC